MPSLPGTLFACLALLVAAPATAAGPSPAHLWHRAAETYESGDLAAFQAVMDQLALLRPYHLGVAKNLARARTLNGDPDAALVILRRVAEQGLALDLAADGDFAPLAEHPGFAVVRARMAANRKPLGPVDVAFTLPRRGVLPEGLAHDPASGDFLVGSVRTGHVYRVRPDGDWSVFIEPDARNGLAGTFGMTVDAPRRRLVVASASPPQHRGPNAGTPSGVLVFDLDSGRLLRRATTGEPGHLLGDVALGPGGEIYASDSASPVVFRLPPEGDRLEPWLAADPAALPNPQGLAVTADGRRLYLADYHRGLFRVTLPGGTLAPVTVPANLNAGGIDGLYAVDGRLVAIQNGVSPQRILALRLDAEGDAVTGFEVLARALPGWDEPTLGTITAGALYYNAASGWPAFDAEGDLAEPAAAGPVVVMRLPL